MVPNHRYVSFSKKINKGDVTKIIQFHKNNTNKINYKPFNSVNKDAKVLNKTFINNYINVLN